MNDYYTSALDREEQRQAAYWETLEENNELSELKDFEDPFVYNTLTDPFFEKRFLRSSLVDKTMKEF